jgi:hypothetical protein
MIYDLRLMIEAAAAQQPIDINHKSAKLPPSRSRIVARRPAAD